MGSSQAENDDFGYWAKPNSLKNGKAVLWLLLLSEPVPNQLLAWIDIPPIMSERRRKAFGIGALKNNAFERGISRGINQNRCKSEIPLSLKTSSLGMTKWERAVDSGWKKVDGGE